MLVVKQELNQGYSRYLLREGVNEIEVEVTDEELSLEIGEEVEVNG